MVSLSKHATAFFSASYVFGAVSAGIYGDRGSLLRPVLRQLPQSSSKTPHNPVLR
jgi:hypothetical protein